MSHNYKHYFQIVKQLINQKIAFISMKLNFAFQNKELNKFKNLMEFMMNFYRKTSRMYMVIQIDESKVATKISGSIRLFLNSQYCSICIILNNSDFLCKMKLQLRNLDSIICFQLKQPLQTLQYICAGGQYINQKLQFYFKKGEKCQGQQQASKRYLKIIRTQQFLNTQKTVEISKPLILMDFNFWQPQEQPPLYIQNLETIHLANLIDEVYRAKRTLDINIQYNKDNKERQNKILATGKLTECLTCKIEQQFDIKGDVKNLKIERTVSGWMIIMFLQVFDYKDLVDIIYTEDSKFLFIFTEDDHTIYIKLDPKKEMKNQDF